MFIYQVMPLGLIRLVNYRPPCTFKCPGLYEKAHSHTGDTWNRRAIAVLNFQVRVTSSPTCKAFLWSLRSVRWTTQRLVLCSQAALIVKNLPARAGRTRDTGSIPGSGRSPCRKKWQPTPVFLPEKFHGQGSLAEYSPWGCKESDRTEWLSTQCDTASRTR